MSILSSIRDYLSLPTNKRGASPFHRYYDNVLAVVFLMLVLIVAFVIGFIILIEDQIFQCSSASRKFLNLDADVGSARAAAFQCSSASRKFLNRGQLVVEHRRGFAFSALQRAENSSILSRTNPRACEARFQCSSASRKFLN